MTELPELIQAAGAAVSAVILALVGWQAGEVRKLRKRVQALEDQAEIDHRKFRDAIRFIRQLLSYIHALTGFVDASVPGAAVPGHIPVIPVTIEDEV